MTNLTKEGIPLAISEVTSEECSSKADQRIRERLAQIYIEARGVEPSQVPDCFQTDPTELVDTSAETAQRIERMYRELEMAKQPVTRAEEPTRANQYFLRSKLNSLLGKIKRW